MLSGPSWGMMPGSSSAISADRQTHTPTHISHQLPPAGRGGGGGPKPKTKLQKLQTFCHCLWSLAPKKRWILSFSAFSSAKRSFQLRTSPHGRRHTHGLADGLCLEALAGQHTAQTCKHRWTDGRTDRPRRQHASTCAAALANPGAKAPTPTTRLCWETGSLPHSRFCEDGPLTT
jgi:hypothetical protein